MAALLRSQLKCPLCGDLIASISRRDFQTCRCGALSIDGGRDYLRVAYNDALEPILRAEDGMRKMDRSISIAGEHNTLSAAVALAVYKALWMASGNGSTPAPTSAIHACMAFVGNRQQITMKSLMAYLKMFAEDDGPVERSGASNAFQWLPKVPLAERSDA